MYTQPNKLLPPTSRIIKPYACAMVATEGPNILGKLDLAGVEIKYDSQYTSRIVLKANAVNQPLMYGFLGNDVTFILLKVTFDELNPYCLIEEDQYIEYFFKDNPNEIRYINKLMILTGNSVKRIPQIYLNNKSDFDVVIDVMVGNLEQTTIDPNTLPGNVILISGIYHNNILSDSIYNSTTGNYGSSQLTVLDYEGNYSLYLNYSEIDTIQIDEVYNKIIIDTKSDTIIHLEFLSRFEMYQGYSRIDWVMKDQLNRILTTDLPTIDNIPPQINLNNITPILENIYTLHINTSETGEFSVTKYDIINYFISSIYDERDGEIDITNLSVTIRKYGELQKLDIITQEGGYDIVVLVSDIANNQTIGNYILIVDVTKPHITFNSVTFNSVNNTYDLSLLADGDNGIITKDIIKNKLIDTITDNIDVILPTVTTSNISEITTKTILITIIDSDNNEVSEITVSGIYDVIISGNDLSNNINIYHKKLVISKFV